MKLAPASLLLATLGVARAAPVTIDLDECLGADRDEVLRIAGVELQHLAPDAPEVAVAVRCPNAESAEITVAGAVRTIDLAAAAEKARPRLLALAIAEMVAARLGEPPPRPPPPRPPPAPPKPRPPAPPPRRIELAAEACAHFVQGAGFVGGGGIRLAHDLPRHLGWFAGADAEHGAAKQAPGTVSIDLVYGDVGLLVHGEWRRVALRGGIGLRAGAARLDGSPASPAVRGATLWGPWLGPLAEVALALSPLARLAIELVLDGGWVALPVTGRVAGGDPVAVDGAWVGLSLAIGARL